jgi:dTDP-4-amino-4,6-dideoxygalactose transaminase
VVYQGGIPVLADIDPETFNLDPEKVRRKITPRTKAILPVHFAGLPCFMEAISELAKDHGLLVIEDACHALGAQWLSHGGRWEKVGSCHSSDMAVFSFHPVKQITTGEGGMVLTNRGDLADRLRNFRHHGIVRGSPTSEEPWRYQMEDLGYNYRITDFQCALGLAQLKKLDRLLDRRREIAARYGRAFADLGLRPQKVTDGGQGHAWHLYAVQLLPERLRTDRGTLFRELRRRGLGVNVHYLPVHLHPFYQRRFSYRSGDFPLAERYYERALTLPLFPRMTDEEVDRVVQVVRSVFREYQQPSSLSVPVGIP